MASSSSDPVDVRELRGVKFSMDVKNPQAMTSGADQAAPSAYGTGAFGLDSDANMAKVVALLVEIRTTLVANGMMKGSA